MHNNSKQDITIPSKIVITSVLVSDKNFITFFFPYSYKDVICRRTACCLMKVTNLFESLRHKGL